MTMIDSHDAAKLATAYFDAMLMVKHQSAFHLPVGVTPRVALDRYIDQCNRCGVQLHNDAWLVNADAAVRRLMARRQRAIA